MIELVRRAVERVAAAGHPGDDVDLLAAGAVDSMGWVDILSTLEKQAGGANLGAQWPEGKPRSIRVLAELLAEARAPDRQPALPAREEAGSAVGVRGWGSTLGSDTVPAAALDRRYGLEAGTIGARTGLESVAWAAPDENEVTLAQRACEQALRAAQADPDDVDVLVVSSETFLGFPSLAAALHGALLLPERCWALDVGGGCLGLLNGLAAAQAILASGAARHALVVAADVHSRRFAGTSTPWQLAALFGDGAGAVLSSAGILSCPYSLGGFAFGCSGSFASAIRIAPGPAGDISVDFHGAQLADAAISRLAGLIQVLEIRSGLPSSQVAGFAVHEPNPRAVDLLARRTGIPPDKFAQVSRTCGNLGSATCAVALCRLLERQPPPGTVFLASLGPGLLWGATYISNNF